LTHRKIGVSMVAKLLEKGIAIHDFPKGCQPLIGEIRVKKQGSQWNSVHRRIGTSGARNPVHEVAISDFPRGSEPLIIAGTRGTRSRGVGVRRFGVLAYNEIAAGETAISRNATGPTVTPFQWRTCVGRSSLVGRR
jgi:hypothetical protein